MPTQITLDDDEAPVPSELLASARLAERGEVPERNAFWALEALLQTQLVTPLCHGYAAQLEQARSSLVACFGD